MPASSNAMQTRRITRIAFFLSLAAQAIPMCYALAIIATAPYHRGPLYTEIRLLILILGLVGALLGILALLRRTRSKALAIIAIILGLAALSWHVVICGSNPLQQGPFCPMLWGIRIP
jgi:hypothetical protein